jgi:hypothetical protein
LRLETLRASALYAWWKRAVGLVAVDGHGQLGDCTEILFLPQDAVAAFGLPGGAGLLAGGSNSLPYAPR